MNGSTGPAGPHASDSEAPSQPSSYWEARYGDREQMWSGRVNDVLAEVASTLSPGTALDLGCGEGADVLWLAEHGWQATGVDISATAVQRAREAAVARGLAEHQAVFVAADLSTFAPQASFDLVTASFFHSPVELAREDILRRAATLVADHGHLLVTSHASAPPWANADAHDHSFPSAVEDFDALALAPESWQVMTSKTRPRKATGPDGQAATVEDSVLLLRRL